MFIYQLRVCFVGPRKFVSQSYDGAIVLSGHHAGVQAILQKTYKHAFFIHCYAHKLNLIIAQATSQNQDSQILFLDLSGITNFFSSNSLKKVSVLDSIVGKRIPYPSVVLLPPPPTQSKILGTSMLPS